MRIACKSMGRADLGAGALGSIKGRMFFPWENHLQASNEPLVRDRDSYILALPPLRKGKYSELELSPDVGLIELGSNSWLMNWGISVQPRSPLRTSLAADSEINLGKEGRCKYPLHLPNFATDISFPSSENKSFITTSSLSRALWRK